jgi:hypothetical protein
MLSTLKKHYLKQHAKFKARDQQFLNTVHGVELSLCLMVLIIATASMAAYIPRLVLSGGSAREKSAQTTSLKSIGGAGKRDKSMMFNGGVNSDNIIQNTAAKGGAGKRD